MDSSINRTKKERKAASNYKYRYGISLEEFYELQRKQKNVCAICGKPETRGKKRLCVDHNHTTGKVRGLLCSQCNVAIAWMGESPDILIAAIQYLGREKFLD